MKESIINWLLEKENPSVRFNTLTQLLNKSQNDIDVIEAKRAIMETGAVVKILNKQNDDGSWDEPIKFYRAKYKGTVWTLLMLAELGADPSDKRIIKACEFILENSQELETGGFSVDTSSKTGGGLPRYVLPCLTGNMVYALIKLGYLEDVRVQRAINWIVKYQRTDDGDTLSKDPYHLKRPSCFNKHSCHLGVAKSLKALVAIPEEKRTKEINEKISEMTDYFLIHHIYKRSHNLEAVSKPGWLRLGFPLMYQTDILELVSIFKELRIDDPRLKDAIQIIRDRQLKDGTWKLQNSYNGRTIVSIEKKGLPSKWITLKSLIVLSK